MSFKAHEKEEIFFFKVMIKLKIQIILALNANQMLEKGTYQGFLVSILLIYRQEDKLSKQEFQNMFPENLPSAPPDAKSSLQ